MVIRSQKEVLFIKIRTRRAYAGAVFLHKMIVQTSCTFLAIYFCMCQSYH